MVEISNIDAIIELILREARARKGTPLTTRIYEVSSDVNLQVFKLVENYRNEERRKKEDENKG